MNNENIVNASIDEINEVNDMTMTEFDVLNQRLREIESAIEDIPEIRKRLDELSITVSFIVESRKHKDENSERREFVRSLAGEYLDSLSQSQINELDGISSQELFGMFRTWADIKGHHIERNRGIVKIVSNTTKKRFNLVNVNGLLRKNENTAFDECCDQLFA